MQNGFDPVAWWSRVDGARTAVIVAASGARLSYRELDALADRWAAWLRRLGVSPGDRVAILAHNRLEFLPLYYACVRLGAVLVPLNWRLSAPELGRVLQDAEPVVIFGEDRTRDLGERGVSAASLHATPRWIDLDRARPAPDDTPGPGAPREPGGEEASMLLYTSGSTGVAKGVIVPHRQVLWNAIATTTAWGLGSEDVGPASTPFFHTGGWHVFTTPLLFRGGTVVLIDSFDAGDYLATLERFGVTVTFGVPTQLAMLQGAADWGRPLPRLRWFISGGAPCAARIKDAVRAAGYRLREGYGLTECGPNCFATNDRAAVDRPGTVGWPMPFLSMRLTDDDGKPLPDGEVGELELRGPQLFGGYFRAPHRTAEVMTADGWLRTGDLACRDADGIYGIRGRRKEMYISGGENVFPGEVEGVLLDCPGVGDVTVVGVPDARWGEVGCAIVVRTDRALSADALVAHARGRLAAYKVPKQVVFVDAIPRLGSGKIDRRGAAALVPPAVAGGHEERA